MPRKKEPRGKKFLEFAKKVGVPPVSVLASTQPPADYSWIPEEALAAVVLGVGNMKSFAGAVVELSAYHPHTGMFQTYMMDHSIPFSAGDEVYFYPAELMPVTEAATVYMATVTEAAAEIVSDDAYTLRDALDKLGIHIKLASVATWTGDERMRLWKVVDQIQDQAQRQLALPPDILSLLGRG